MIFILASYIPPIFWFNNTTYERKAGSTFCSLVIYPNKTISSNLGDSRADLAILENGQYNAINLTKDHKTTESMKWKEY